MKKITLEKLIVKLQAIFAIDIGGISIGMDVDDEKKQRTLSPADKDKDKKRLQ